MAVPSVVPRRNLKPSFGALMLVIPKPGYLKRRLRRMFQRTDTSITDANLRSVLKYYDISRWKRGRSLGGGNSANLLLKTNRGRLVFKQYLWSTDSTEQEHSIVEKLAQDDFPTPSLVKNKEGNTYTIDGDRHYGVYEFCPGQSVSYYLFSRRTRARVVALAGAALGRLHRVLEGFEPRGRKYNGFKPGDDVLWRDVSWHVDVLERFLSTSPAARQRELYDFVANIATPCKKYLAACAPLFARDRVDLPVTVIHGDYGLHNVFYSRSDGISVLDLGDACVSLRALDLSRALASFAGDGSYDLDPGLASAFLEGYREEVEPYRAELEAVGPLLQWRYLSNIVWKLYDILERGDAVPARLQSSRKKWATVEWLEADGGHWTSL